MGDLVKTEMGRPPLVRRDRKRVKLMIDAVADGHSTTMVAQAGGVARRTLYEWLYKGQDVREARQYDPEARVTPYDDDYLWFLEEWEKAELSRKQELLDRIAEAGKDPKRWQANAWLAERLYPDEFSLRRNVKVEDNSTKEVFTLTIGRPHEPGKEIPADYEIVE